MNELDDNKDIKIMNSKKRKRVVNMIVRTVRNPIQHGYSSGIGKASFVHALIVIFLEFFAWGLLTDQVITVLNETFPNSTFLANGLIHGVKGILSFLSAPLIGALSDIFGRKVFLLITVFFTCLPIPLMRINPMWYFAMISISGLFAVTFSVVFAYVADVTDESNRTTAYGLVSATFAASLITSPALGSYLSKFYSENFVITLATAIAIFDLFFILVAVPESLPEKLREKSKTISWEHVDPFKSLRVIFADRTITLLCITVFLSYLPEAGQYSCFFVYLKLIVGFSQQQVAYFIAYVGILSCIAQAAILVILIKYFGSKQSIIIGLSFQVMQLALYAFAGQSWLIWFSGFLAAVSSIGYPAISAYISNHSHADQQGVSQGMVTGIRGLCNGIGPALYGFIFWIFRVNLNETTGGGNASSMNTGNQSIDSNDFSHTYAMTHLLPGPPFLFGSVLACSAIFVTWLIPSTFRSPILLQSNSNTASTSNTGNHSSKKETTVVKIGNSSITYNRTSSNSSLTPLGSNKMSEANLINNSSSQALMLESNDLIMSDLITYKNLQEKENLLSGDDTNGENLLLLSSTAPSSSSSAASPSNNIMMPADTADTLTMLLDRSGSPTGSHNSGVINQAYANTLGKQNSSGIVNSASGSSNNINNNPIISSHLKYKTNLD